MKRALWALPIAAVLIALLGFGLSYGPGGTPASPLLNKPAPVFALRTIDGRSLSLTHLRGHPVVLNFWASWCVSCKDEHPYLLDAYRQFAGKGVEFIGITFSDAAGDSRAFLRRHGGSWPNLTDPDQATAVAYGVSAVPETFIIDRHGIVRFKSTGPITPAGPVTPNDLAAELNQLLGGAA
jgi:cytochrome c biogenesis protein CcmG/thiol:disulfide interchange protein DsbE